MRLKGCLRLREIAGEFMLVPMGDSAVNFNSVFSLSESAAWLWTSLQDKDFDEAMAVSLLEGEYEVEHETAVRDVAAILLQWKEYGLTDE